MQKKEIGKCELRRRAMVGWLAEALAGAIAVSRLRPATTVHDAFGVAIPKRIARKSWGRLILVKLVKARAALPVLWGLILCAALARWFLRLSLV